MSAFNPNAKTPAEHALNCSYELSVLADWLAFNQSAPMAHSPLEYANLRASELLKSAELLKAALEAELRQRVSGGENQQPLTAEPATVSPGTAGSEPARADSRPTTEASA